LERLPATPFRREGGEPPKHLKKIVPAGHLSRIYNNVIFYKPRDIF
jgi:hypothetical protein